MIGFALIALLLLRIPEIGLSKVDPLCEPLNSAIEKKVLIPDRANYFFRTFPTKNWVSYNGSGQNKILDLDTGNSFPLAGEYDPVPLWNEKVITYPHEKGMRFLSVPQIIGQKKGQTIPHIHTETSTLGVYQSIGLLGTQGERETYRIVTDYTPSRGKKGVSITDLQVTGASGNPVFRTLRSQKQVCVGVDLKLPMVSKDGSELAALDTQTNTTKLFKIDAATGRCAEIADLGLNTGKVDFSFDGKSLTFHMTSGESGDGSYFENTGEFRGMNVYVYERGTGKIKALTNNLTTNSYYPVFRRDGKIVFVHLDPSTAQFAFAVANPAKKASPVPCHLNGRAKVAFEALQGLISNYCADGVLKNKQAMEILALSLPTESCHSLVRAAIKTEGLTIGLKESDLLAACPKQAQPVVTGQRTQLQGASGASDPRALLKSRCAICHSAGSMKIDFGNVSLLRSAKSKAGKSLALEIVDQIKSGKMPKGGSLTNSERQAMVSFIQGGP